MMQTESSSSLSKTARTAGFLYLIIIVLAGFSQGYIRESIVISNDALKTAENILASPLLFRFGIVSDLTAFLSDLALSVFLFVLLADAGRTISLLAASFRLVAHPAITAVNLLNHYAAYQVLQNNSYLQSFTIQQRESMSLFFMDIHRNGYLIAGAFFGIHLLLIGYLLLKSKHFPSFLGWLTGIAGAGYLIETFGNFIIPGNAVLFGWIVGISAALGEVTLCLYLLVKGVRKPLHSGLLNEQEA